MFLSQIEIIFEVSFYKSDIITRFKRSAMFIFQFQVWQHLTEIQFLPHQKNKDITSMLPGFYGNILTTVEISNHTYDVTKEYLQTIMTLIELPSDVLIEADKTHKLYMNVAVNIVLVIKEIFAHFGRWKFSLSQDKELIALKCLEIFHQLLSPKYEMSPKIKERYDGITMQKSHLKNG